MNMLKVKLSKLLTVALLLCLTALVNATEQTKKVVMIVSSYGQQQGEEKPGYEFDEFAKAFLVFNANGIAVDVASPAGGMAEADKYDPSKPYNAKVLANSEIMAKLSDTLATSALDPNDYDGIFIVGGKGAMFDLPKDEALKSIIADIYHQQGTVAAVCHGPAALVDVKLNDGSYLVANKMVNGFTNDEETLFGKKWLNQFDFMLEDKLVERGGKFQSSEIMLSHVAVDERLITGQNPTSTVDVATELVKKLGLTPVATKPDTDDKTLAVVARLLAGDKTAANELASNRQQYHIALVGMYGFYYLKLADSNVEYENALTLMLVAQDELKNPVLDMQIAKTQQKLGQEYEARSTLEQLLARQPDYAPAVDMLKTMSL
ncbi:MAG: hypothetical protein Alis3KO_22060 [Aliiglaciecola sp.]